MFANLNIILKLSHDKIKVDKFKYSIKSNYYDKNNLNKINHFIKDR
jgi:hypothetical protein